MSEVSTTQRQTPTKKEEEQPENVGAAIGKALGGFGGFGGFGKKKKKEEPAPSAQTSQPSTNSDKKVSATLMTTTTELKGFSTSAVDGGLFEVPAGYKLKDRD